MIIPEDHLARSIWAFVDAMDTNACYWEIKTFNWEPGRPTTCPKILLTLWLYSVLDGNISSRKLECLCKNHNAYKWIAGGAPINRTMLSDFRTKNPMIFEDLLTSCLAVMYKEELISDEDFSQDGTRVKGSAGFNSYKTEETLEKLKNEIKDYILSLTIDNYENKKRINLVRIANERLNRVEAALKTIKKEKEIKKENGKKNHNKVTQEDLDNVRASTVDPAIRKMKMGDGGFRLAYNIQFATGLESRVIFGVDTVTHLDPGSSAKMIAIVSSRLSIIGMNSPKRWVGDSAYSSASDLNLVSDMFPDLYYYAPPQVNKGQDPKKNKKTDTQAIIQWREKIDTKEANELYKKRCSTAEFSNAQVKNHGLKEFLVRGIEKVKSMSILHAISHNILRCFDLRAKNKKQTIEPQTS